MKYTKLYALAVAAACALSMAPLAGAAEPCKSGQKTAHKASAKCTPASAAKANATAKSAGKPKGKTKSTSKAKGKGRGRSTVPVPAFTADPPQTRAAADCESTQAMLQGAAGQCTAVSLPAGLTLPNAPQFNPGAACFEALASSNASRRLAHKVPFFAASAASPQALDNQGVAVKMEKEELRSVIAGYGMCLDMAASWRRETYAPAAVSALDAYWLQVQATLNALVTGKKTYGEAARAIAENDKAYRSTLGALDKSL